jgi:hypothetical protein
VKVDTGIIIGMNVLYELLRKVIEIFTVSSKIIHNIDNRSKLERARDFFLNENEAFMQKNEPS